MHSGTTKGRTPPSMSRVDTGHGVLGNKASCSASYDPKQLFPIARKESRKELGVSPLPPFVGVDIWNAYELSWLGENGIPRIAVATFHIEADSINIVESKSVKLYLNSFNQTRFSSAETVCATIERDIALSVQGAVRVTLVQPDRFCEYGFSKPEGFCIDDQPVARVPQMVDPNILSVGKGYRCERLYSNLLRTKCPVTDQPDWATLFIDYEGPELDKTSLLSYLVSFRQHNGFHESCVEQIYCDIMHRCKPIRLEVRAQFTRRGGIDINPVRSSSTQTFENFRLYRQ